MTLQPQLIIEALKHVRYPGNGKDIVSLGMIQEDLQVNGMKVSFSLLFLINMMFIIFELVFVVINLLFLTFIINWIIEVYFDNAKPFSIPYYPNVTLTLFI